MKYASLMVLYVVLPTLVCAQEETVKEGSAAITKIVGKHQRGNPATHALDEDPRTKWAAQGRGQTLEVTLDKAVETDKILIGFDHPERKYKLELSTAAEPGKPYRQLREFTSAGQGQALEEIKFPAIKIRQLKLTCLGSDANDWNNIHSLKIPGTVVKVAVATASDKPQASKAGTLEFSRWSGALNIPDPVAISFDNHGRAYVTQTQRRKSQDLDIRAFGGWVADDVGFESVDDKRAFYRRELAVGENNRRIKDHNGDGTSDYRDLMVLSELIHRVEDTDADGTADKISLFANGFQTEVTGIAAGVLWHAGDVYTTIAPDVWRLRDTDKDGTIDQRQVVATGFGVHIAYAGHDMHGLTVGPDGKIYWTIGDKGISASSQDGKHFHYPNQGGVMRCNPDGSDFEVFAHGLRNVQEIAFDQFGNLFGVDNDADQSGERERLVYIVPGMDAGWRCNYQYRGRGYNPWTAEKLWVPYYEGQPAYIVPPLGFSLNGPAGFAFNPGTALNERYHNYFFLTGAPGGEQRAFRMEPDGAKFKIADEHQIGRGTPLVGINFGPDGALYGVDWGGGYPLNKRGAIWKIDVAVGAPTPARQDTKQLLLRDLKQVSNDQLAELLGHADQRIRLNAQFELVRRDERTKLMAVATMADQKRLARVHAVWGMGQLLRTQHTLTDTESKHLQTLLRDGDLEVCAQALRVVTDIREFPAAQLLPLLKHAHPRIQMLTALALRRHTCDRALAELIELAESITLGDTYLRHAIAMGMSNAGVPRELANLNKHPAAIVRVLAVLALRQQYEDRTVVDDMPILGQFLLDGDNIVSTEAALAIYEGLARFDAKSAAFRQDVSALASSLQQPQDHPEASVRRAIGANFHLGEPKHARQLVRYAARQQAPQQLRLDALDALAKWNRAPELDRVDGRRRRYATRGELTAADVPAFGVLLNSSDEAVRAAALKVTRAINLAFGEAELKTLAQVVRNPSAQKSLRMEALDTLVAQKYPQAAELQQFALAAADVAVRIHALQSLLSDKHRCLPAALKILDQSEDVAEIQHALVCLGQLDLPEADQRLVAELNKLVAGNSRAELQLEVLSAVSARAAQVPQLKETLAKYEATRRKADLVAQWAECLAGGDAQRGSELFRTHLTAACVRCHRLGETGSTVGPRLSGIGKKRKADHLLRAIIDPSADIDPEYRSKTIILLSGKILQGLIIRKDDRQTVVADAQGKQHVLDNEEIDEVIEKKQSIMPAMGKVLTRHQIRDLVTFLRTLQTPEE